MKRINYTSLKRGDIIFTTSPEPVSKLIRGVTKSDISHAMLYVSETSALESTGDGVHSLNLQKKFYDDSCAIYALRPKIPLTEEQLNQVIGYARSAIGTPYSMFEAARSVTGTSRSGSRKQFCSRFVARAYAAADVNLVKNPDFCTPEDVLASHLLSLIPHTTDKISDEEIQAWSNSPQGTAAMTDVTNKFLESVRQYSPEILNINDGIQFAISNPDMDAAVAAAFKSSGYLDEWRTQPATYPWRYDLSLMEAFAQQPTQKEAVREYCEITIRNEATGDFQHWKDNLDAYKNYFNQLPRKSLAVMVELYENLVRCHRDRVETAQAWLSLNPK